MWRGEVEKVREILEKGEDPNEADSSSFTALHFAVKSSNVSVEILELLLKHGAKRDHLGAQDIPYLLCAIGNKNMSGRGICFLSDNGFTFDRKKLFSDNYNESVALVLFTHKLVDEVKLEL